MLLDKAVNSNGMVREIYLTISVFKRSIEDARNYFRRVSTDIVSHLAKLGSKCIELDAREKLRIIHDFYRIGEEVNYNLDIKDFIKKDITLKIIYVQMDFRLKKIILKWEKNMVEFYS